VTLIERGFGDHKLYLVLTEELKFDYVIRFRGNITVTAADGEARTAASWVGPGGRARVAKLTCAPKATATCSTTRSRWRTSRISDLVS
jgi:hypothetical protein